MNKKLEYQDELEDFSLVLGGPLYQLYLRTRLAKPPLKLYQRRILAFIILTWLPLLILTMIDGTAVSGIKVPFFYDFASHARFLVALTLLIAAELVVHQRIRFTMVQFVDRDIITLEERPLFDSIIASNMRLKNSIIVELSLIVIAIIAGHWIWKEFATLSVSTWYATISDGIPHITPAGYWGAFVSVPIFQFILLRWYFRIFVWYRILWQVSRLPLRLNSLHPDKAGGLGFLAYSAFAFGLVLLAHSVLLAGVIANRIWYEGANLKEFKLAIAGVIVYLILLVFVPLTFFFFQLARAKRIGSREFGIIASHYVNDFRSKWTGADLKRNETLLGTSDIQSLADLSNSFTVGHEMRLLPFNLRTVVQIVIVIFFPFIPLLLTIIPFEEMIGPILKIIL